MNITNRNGVRHLLDERKEMYNVADKLVEEAIRKVSLLISETFLNKGKLIIFGNGGSAAESQHFAAELIGKFKEFRQPFPAISLNSDNSVITCIGNDFGFEQVFARQIEALANHQDLVIAFSTSGNSRNVLLALKAAGNRACKRVLMTGENFNQRDGSLFDFLIVAPSKSTALIQEFHLSIIHILCQLFDDTIVVGKTLTNDVGEKKIYAFNDSRDFVSMKHLKESGTVFANGCFDILHAGHFALIRQAAKLGRKLVIGLNSDSSVKSLKGESRPINNAVTRAENLLATGYVDYVVIFEESTPLNLIRYLQPGIVVKGSDYSNINFPEKSFIEEYGGTIEFVSKIDGFSTSNVIAKIKQS